MTELRARRRSPRFVSRGRLNSKSFSRSGIIRSRWYAREKNRRNSITHRFRIFIKYARLVVAVVHRVRPVHYLSVRFRFLLSTRANRLAYYHLSSPYAVRKPVHAVREPIQRTAKTRVRYCSIEQSTLTHRSKNAVTHCTYDDDRVYIVVASYARTYRDHTVSGDETVGYYERARARTFGFRISTVSSTNLTRVGCVYGTVSLT